MAFQQPHIQAMPDCLNLGVSSPEGTPKSEVHEWQDRKPNCLGDLKK